MNKILSNIEEAAALLLSGQVVAIPTETVYGLAANAMDSIAIQTVFNLKKRPQNHPLILHISKHCELNEWVSFIPDYAKKLMALFWPGPLTLVMHATSNVSSLITGGQTTVALRCPDHPVVQSLLNALPVPLVAPSANIFGKVSPTTALHVQENFKHHPIPILEGGRCRIGIESTIVDATLEDSFQVLRAGVITEKMLQNLLPKQLISREKTYRVSGQLKTHYQPQKKLYYFKAFDDIRAWLSIQNISCYIMSFESVELNRKHLYYLMPQTPDKAAFELYYQLQEADHSSATMIIIQLPPEGSEWDAVRERLYKAGTAFTLKE